MQCLIGVMNSDGTIYNENVGWYTTVKPFINEKMDDWNNSMKKIIKEIAGTL